MGVKGKGAGGSGGVSRAGMRASAPSTLPRAWWARGIQESKRPLILSPRFFEIVPVARIALRSIVPVHGPRVHVLVASAPRVVWHLRGRRRERPPRFQLHHGGLHGSLLNLMPAQLLAAIVEFHDPVFPFAHHHLALRRSMPPGLPLYLIEPVVVPHHPVVAQHPLGLQPKNLSPLLGSRRG